MQYSMDGYVENVAQFKDVGRKVTNINLFLKEIVMDATIQSRTFCLLICSPNT
jgi:hypothetical protein